MQEPSTGRLTLQSCHGSCLQPDPDHETSSPAAPNVLSDGLLAGGDRRAKRKPCWPDGLFAEPGW